MLHGCVCRILVRGALTRRNAYAATSSTLQGACVLWVKVAPPTLEQVFDKLRSRCVGFLAVQPVTAMAAPAMIMRAPAIW